MNTCRMQDPVIVMGMMRSGTTLLAEMLHKGGTPMFADCGDTDPSYDGGIRYERRLTLELNLRILGLEKNQEAITLLGLPLHPLPEDALARLAEEVRDAPWGFKNPRTTLTYPIWRQTFPCGPRLYIYRGHVEVMRFYFHSRRNWASRIKRTRRAIEAWVCFNEQIIHNIRMDQEAERATALVRYEELMQDPALIGRIEAAVGVPLHDARNTKMRRNCIPSAAECGLYRLLSTGYEQRIARVYEELGALRLTA